MGNEANIGDENMTYLHFAYSFHIQTDYQSCSSHMRCLH